MVSAGEDLLSHLGYGVTMLEVIERADAPRGSICYDFPNGRSGLAIEVAHKVRAEIGIFVAQTSAKIPETGPFLSRLVEHHCKRLVSSEYVFGCPLMGVIASGDMDAKLAIGVEETSETGTSTIGVALGKRGFTPADAAQLASLMVAGSHGYSGRELRQKCSAVASGDSYSTQDPHCPGTRQSRFSTPPDTMASTATCQRRPVRPDRCPTLPRAA